MLSKRFLIISNIFFIVLIAIFVARHLIFRFNVSSKNPIEVQAGNSTNPAKPDCNYSLEYFNFHWKKESQNPKIIMLGNSLVRHGNWDSLLARNDVINRGISGDHLPCIYERLKFLKNSSAKIIFIEGGINDLPVGNTDTLFYYYSQIVKFWIKEKNFR